MEAGHWARAAEAAMALNVSEKTIRRKAQRGVLPARRVSTSHGEAWQVWLPDGDTRGAHGGPSADSMGDQAEQGGPSASAAPNGQVQGVESAALLEALHQLATQRDQLLHLAGQLGYLQRQVQEQQEQLRALSSPAEPPQTASAPESAQDGHLAAVGREVVSDALVKPSVAPRKAWWRFW